MLTKIAFLLIYVLALVPRGNGKCYDPSPAFPALSDSDGTTDLYNAFNDVEATLKSVVQDPKYATSSFSVEVTTSQTTLWSLHHTARDKNESRPGSPTVNTHSAYRIASITKTFTVLGILQQHAAGNLSLDDTIAQYIAELEKPQNGSIPWKDITLRSLASQLSGIPREFAQSDLANELADPTRWGLPPVSHKRTPACDEYRGYNPCTRKELLQTIQSNAPLYPPNQKSTYSNVAFELLGLAIENVTGLSYEDYIVSSILNPLRMKDTSFAKPPDAVAVIPKGTNFWDVDEGIQNPTGGLYSSSTDLSRFLRYILSHYNGITHALNWLQPASWSTGMSSFFGVPWEIYRTDKILNNTSRPVTFVTKSGGLPGYSSIIMILPEYNLGITILVASDPQGPGGDLFPRIRNEVTLQIVRAAELVAQKSLRKRYAGRFASSTLNSSITLSHNPSRGLHISNFISNGTDVLATWQPLIYERTGGSDAWRAQLIPTLLYKDQDKLAGEQWRMLIVPEERMDEAWDDFCITDEDDLMYDGEPLNEIVFWEGADGDVEGVEMTAFRVRLERQGPGKEGECCGRKVSDQRVLQQE